MRLEREMRGGGGVIEEEKRGGGGVVERRGRSGRVETGRTILAGGEMEVMILSVFMFMFKT